MGDGQVNKLSNNLKYIDNMGLIGGGSGIRTLGTLSRPSVFKTGAIDHSAKPPLYVLPKTLETILQLGKITLKEGKFADLDMHLLSQGVGAGYNSTNAPQKGRSNVRVNQARAQARTRVNEQ